MKKERYTIASQMRDFTKARVQMIHGITENHSILTETEQCKILATNIIELVNKKSSRDDFIRDILFFIKVVTGLEAIGIRLQEGDDFPYFETIGFSKNFVKAEKYLCARDHAGNLIRDDKGNPFLECMCGNIICGRTDPSHPFFTKAGSFWTNSTTALLSSTTKEDRQGRTRNRCNRAGYESVALIPLRCDEKVIGLLQLNDRRKNIFTETLISFFERIGSNIAIALKLKQREASILARKNANIIDKTIITYHDANFNIISANETAKKILALPPLEEAEIKCYKYYHGRDYPPKNCPACKCLLSREPVFFKIIEPHLNKHIEIRVFPQFDENDKFIGSIHFVRDSSVERLLSDKCCSK
jgi:hypothetical protein